MGALCLGHLRYLTVCITFVSNPALLLINSRERCISHFPIVCLRFRGKSLSSSCQRFIRVYRMSVKMLSSDSLSENCNSSLQAQYAPPDAFLVSKLSGVDT